MCGFVENTGLKSTYMAEFCGTMIAKSERIFGWTHSTLVVMTFKSSALVP
jgi:hypothetical protein